MLPLACPQVAWVTCAVVITSAGAGVAATVIQAVESPQPAVLSRAINLYRPAGTFNRSVVVAIAFLFSSIHCVVEKFIPESVMPLMEPLALLQVVHDLQVGNTHIR